MKYFIAESIMTDPMPVSKEEFLRVYAPQHVAHMKQGIDAGIVLMAGPNELGGGFLLMRTETRAAAEAFLAEDVYPVNGLNRFRLTEYDPKDRAEMVMDW